MDTDQSLNATNVPSSDEYLVSSSSTHVHLSSLSTVYAAAVCLLSGKQSDSLQYIQYKLEVLLSYLSEAWHPCIDDQIQ